MDVRGIVERAHVVALPMRERFRGIDVREAVLIEDAGGEENEPAARCWAEWSPFAEYPDPEATTWLRAALASFSRAEPPVGATVGVNATVPAVAAGAVAGVLARFPGCRTAKVKVAQPGQSLADDLDRVAAVRDVLGPLGRIRVDANAAWGLDDAERALVALARYDLEYAEQPVATVDDLARLRRRIRPLVPIAADESIRKADDPFAVLRAEAADVLILKLQPLGGPERVLEIVDAAMAAGVECVTSSALETSVGLSAAADMARRLDERQAREHDHGLGTAALLAADVASDPLVPLDGRIPARPVAPEPELLERWAAPAERASFWLDRLRRCLELL